MRMEMMRRMSSTRREQRRRMVTKKGKTRWTRLIAISQRIWRRISSKLLLVFSVRVSAKSLSVSLSVSYAA